MSALVMLISALMSSAATATIVGYLLSVFGSLVSVLVASTIYGEIPCVTAPMMMLVPMPVPRLVLMLAPLLLSSRYLTTMLRMPSALFCWPQLAMARAVYLINHACIFDGRCPQEAAAGSELRAALGSMFLTSVLYTAAAVLIDRRAEGAGGGSLSGSKRLELLCDGAARARARARQNEDEDATELVEVGPLGCDSDAAELEEQSINVERGEKQSVQSAAVAAEGRKAAAAYSAAGADSPLVLRQLRQVYGSGKAQVEAVKGVSLMLQPKESFGLLGKNGAGKTSLLKVLTGVHSPTDGDALVGGASVVRELNCAASN